MKNTKMKELLQKLGTLMALAILVLIFCITMPDKFMKVGNFMNILKQASINCLIASGMLCALITAGIDLSVGSNCVLCTCTIGVMVQSGITNPFLLVLCGLAVSTLAGFINGTLLTRLDLPHPFVSTMGMKNVLWGLALVITGSKSIAFTNTGIDGLMWIGGGSLFTTYYEGTTKVKFPGIPFSFVLVIIVFIIFIDCAAVLFSSSLFTGFFDCMSFTESHCVRPAKRGIKSARLSLKPGAVAKLIPKKLFTCKIFSDCCAIVSEIPFP